MFLTITLRSGGIKPDTFGEYAPHLPFYKAASILIICYPSGYFERKVKSLVGLILEEVNL